MQEVPSQQTPQDPGAGPAPAGPTAPTTSGSDNPPPPISPAGAAGGLGHASQPPAGVPPVRSQGPPLLAGPTAPRAGGRPSSHAGAPGGRSVDGGAGSGGRRSGKGTLIWTLVALVVVGGLVCVGGGLYLLREFGQMGSGRMAGRSSKHSDLHEVVLEAASTRDKIAVIDMQGVISSDPFDYEGNTLVKYIEEQLERAADDEHVRAVLLKIDSPGGEVLASDEIYKLLSEFQEEHDKPVIASMGTVAASGGYYVAAPCRWIVANELTITGSIGVIMQSYNWRALMDKVGVRPQVFKSGVFKDMLSPDKSEADITAEERRMVQDLVNETFEKFKAVIEEGRGLAHARNEDNQGEAADQGRKLASNWKDYADGRLLSGKDAWKLGFVDELGDFSAAVDRARKLSGIEDAKLIQYLRPASFGSLFRLLGRSADARVTVDLGIRMPSLRAGLYFLASPLVR